MGGYAATGVTDGTITVSGFGASGQASVTYYYAPVPEPASGLLVATGLAGLSFAGRRRSGEQGG